MIVLGVESSCDECAVAAVKDGSELLGQIVHSQIQEHEQYRGVVPEIASRQHTQLILPVYRQAIRDSGITAADIDVVAVTTHPGLSGSLLVGTTFAKGLSLGLDRPLVSVNHILAHLYAPRLTGPVDWPCLGLLVSGGHTMIVRMDDWETLTVLGATVDDACGEAFDKVAKYHGFGYPGGKAVDELAARGDETAYEFPGSSLKGDSHDLDLSYSGIKTAVTVQASRFLRPGKEDSAENLAASFQRVAIGMIMKRLDRAVQQTGIHRLVVGGGVAANSRLRRELAARTHLQLAIPPLSLCTDNAAMVAAIGYEYAIRGRFADLDTPVGARVAGYKAAY
ncbi:MAG: tRNA (adenosine(37)-N6)-threonylcarbamoyltransferase complex transferase subunit TsaD [Spirochaetaceae bacterium]|nr:MAG: tRNA (adenosine(37)-N6)-threonylcarbamoyltransferase complex transferase subunit TsaD [Spirochaetaceae bacterium]